MDVVAALRPVPVDAPELHHAARSYPAQDMRRHADVSDIANKVSESLLPSIEANIEACGQESDAE